MKRIKDFFKNYDDEMAAYAFAEAGELEMAKQILSESERTMKSDSSDDDDYKEENIGVVIPLRSNVR